jgi:hypothetical protein
VFSEFTYRHRAILFSWFSGFPHLHNNIWNISSHIDTMSDSPPSVFFSDPIPTQCHSPPCTVGNTLTLNYGSSSTILYITLTRRFHTHLIFFFFSSQILTSFQNPRSFTTSARRASLCPATCNIWLLIYSRMHHDSQCIVSAASRGEIPLKGLF